MVKGADQLDKKSKKKDKSSKKEKKSLKDKKRSKKSDKKSKRKQSDEVMEAEVVEAEVVDTSDDEAIATTIKTPKEKKVKAVVEKPKTLQWLPKQLFISGIPYDTTKDQLLEFFIDEKAMITEVKLPTFQDSGRCVGYAHVTFKTKETYDSALTKNGNKLGPRYLDIKEAQGTARPEPS